MQSKNPNLVSRKVWTLAIVAMLVSVTACGKSKDDDDDADTAGTVTGTGGTGKSSTTDVPSDSTGASGSVSLSFGTAGATALALQGATTIAGGTGIILSDARISVASIKIKANKDESETEKQGKAAVEAEKEKLEQALESQKTALEQTREAVKQSYEPQFQAAQTEAEEDALEAQMRIDLAASEEALAALEATKDAQLAELEAAKDGNLKWKGPYVYDLVGKTVDPVLPEVSLVDGSYRRIEFKIKPNRTLAGTDPLLNNSVYVAGTVDVGGVATSFTVSLRVDEEFKLMGAGAFKVDPSLPNALTIAFDPTVWFSNVDLSSGLPDATGTIVVSDTSNPGLFEQIRDNLKSSTKFGKDDDGDGDLAVEESEGDGEEGVAAAAL